jgi:hypothetical protein
MFSRHLQHFFRSLEFSYISNTFFTLILRFWNFKLPAIYIFKALTEGFDIKWQSLKCLHKINKMASAERLLVCTCFIAYYRYLLVSHPTKLNMYAALQNESGVSS